MLGPPFIDPVTSRVRIGSNPSGVLLDGLEAAFRQKQLVTVVKSAASGWQSAYVPPSDRGVVFNGTSYFTRAAPQVTLADSKQITVAGTFRLDSLTGVQAIFMQQILGSTGATQSAVNFFWNTTILSILLNDGDGNVLGQTRYTPSGALVVGVTYAYVWAINLATGVSTLRIDDVDRTTTWSIAAVDSEIGFTSASTAPYVVGALSGGTLPFSGHLGRVWLFNQFIDPSTNWSKFFAADGTPLDPTEPGYEVSVVDNPNDLFLAPWTIFGPGAVVVSANILREDAATSRHVIEQGALGALIGRQVLTTHAKAVSGARYALLRVYGNIGPATNWFRVVVDLFSGDVTQIMLGATAQFSEFNVTTLGAAGGYQIQVEFFNADTFNAVALGLSDVPVPATGSFGDYAYAGDGVSSIQYKNTAIRRHSYTFESAEAVTVAPALNLQLETSDPDSFGLNTRASGGALTPTGAPARYLGPNLAQATEADMPVATINLANPDITAAWTLTGNATVQSGYADPDGGMNAHLVTFTATATCYAVGPLPATRTGDTIKVGQWVKRVSGAATLLGIYRGSGSNVTFKTVTSEWQFLAADAIAIVNGAAANYIGITNSATAGDSYLIYVPQASITTGQLDTNVMPPFVPFNTAPRSLVFDGVSDKMLATIAGLQQPTTALLKGTQITWLSTDRIFDGLTGNSGGLYQVGTSPTLRAAAGVQLGTGLTGEALDTTQIYSVVFDGVNSRVQVGHNPPVTGDAGANDMGGLTLAAFGGGASSFGNIEVTDVLIYSKVLSQDEIDDSVAALLALPPAFAGMLISTDQGILYTTAGAVTGHSGGLPQVEGSLLVDLTAAAIDYMMAPAIPFTAAGAVAMDLSAPVDHVHNGVPYTAAGHIAAIIV